VAVHRVLLAGAAAHQMSPFFGQGMCSRILDVTNLAWKLDHVVRRGSPTGLLDTYESEQRPHVRRIIEAAPEFGRP
jgi:2-polyprenyl-6-methoxyphenol hydroxylase-like FAD-dependent oxidoreductase